MMGVPVTFLDKYNPEQFEVVGIAKTWFEKIIPLRTKTYPKQIQVDKNGKESVVSKLNDGAVRKIAEPIKDTYYLVNGELYKQEYARVFVRRVM